MAVGKGLSSRLRERVTLQEPNLVDNNKGGRRPAPGEDKWRDLARDVAAEVLPLRGDEALTLGVNRATQLYRVTMRCRAGLVPANRLIWGGMVLNIRTAPPSTDRASVVMTCESGVAT